MLVYEDGKLVDDTQRQATQEKEAALRERALRELAARKEEAERSKVEEAQPAGGDETAADEGVTKEDDAIAIFRAIISEWDRRKGKAQAAGGGTQGATAPAEPATAGP